MELASERSRHVRRPRRLHPRGQAGVAVVEADDVETAGREQLAESIVPADHLRAKARHKEQGRRFRIAEILVLDVDPVGSRSWHQAQSYKRPGESPNPGSRYP